MEPKPLDCGVDSRLARIVDYYCWLWCILDPCYFDIVDPEQLELGLEVVKAVGSRFDEELLAVFVEVVEQMPVFHVVEEDSRLVE